MRKNYFGGYLVLKCKNCEREYLEEFLFCPYCGEEKVIVDESDEERLKKVLPILKETFEDVTSVGVESILLKLDEQRALLLNTIEEIESFGEKISEEKKMSETSIELIPETPAKPVEKATIDRKKDIVQAFSMIALCMGAVAIALSLILPYTSSFMGLNLISEYVLKSLSAIVGGVDLKTLSTIEISYYITCWSLIVALVLYIIDSVYSIVRLLNGKTKGRFYLIPTFAFVFAVISLCFANVANMASFGAYVLSISVLFRIILGFFMPRTKIKE